MSNPGRNNKERLGHNNHHPGHFEMDVKGETNNDPPISGQFGKPTEGSLTEAISTIARLNLTAASPLHNSTLPRPVHQKFGPHQLLSLQRTIGNQAVQRLLHQQRAGQSGNINSSGPNDKLTSTASNAALTSPATGPQSVLTNSEADATAVQRIGVGPTHQLKRQDEYGPITVATETIEPKDQDPALKAEYPAMEKAGERPKVVQGYIAPTKEERDANADPLSFSTTMDEKKVALALRGFIRGHVIAVSAGGNNESPNVVPQHPRSNVSGQWKQFENASLKKARELQSENKLLYVEVTLGYAAPSTKDDIRIPSDFQVKQTIVEKAQKNDRSKGLAHGIPDTIPNKGMPSDETAKYRKDLKVAKHEINEAIKKFDKKTGRSSDVKAINAAKEKLGENIVYSDDNLKKEIEILDLEGRVELLKIYITDKDRRKTLGINRLPSDQDDRKQKLAKMELKPEDILKELDTAGADKATLYKQMYFFREKKNLTKDHPKLKSKRHLRVKLVRGLPEDKKENLLGKLPPAELRIYAPLEGTLAMGESESFTEGADFSETQKKAILAYNMKLNGTLVSDAPNDRYPILKEHGKLSAPEIDHIVPKSLGGRNAFSNARVISHWLNNRGERVVTADEKLKTIKDGSKYEAKSDLKTHPRGSNKYQIQLQLQEDLKKSRQIYEDTRKGYKKGSPVYNELKTEYQKYIQERTAQAARKDATVNIFVTPQERIKQEGDITIKQQTELQNAAKELKQKLDETMVFIDSLSKELDAAQKKYQAGQDTYIKLGTELGQLQSELRELESRQTAMATSATHNLEEQDITNGSDTAVSHNDNPKKRMLPNKDESATSNSNSVKHVKTLEKDLELSILNLQAKIKNVETLLTTLRDQDMPILETQAKTTQDKVTEAELNKKELQKKLEVTETHLKELTQKLTALKGKWEQYT